jgi:hypothetical protein
LRLYSDLRAYGLQLIIEMIYGTVYATFRPIHIQIIHEMIQSRFPSQFFDGVMAPCAGTLS